MELFGVEIVRGQTRELEKIKLTCKTGPAKSYVQVASGPMIHRGPSVKPETEKRINNEKHEVVLIKPVEVKGRRNNEQIKEDLVKELAEVRKDLRIKSMRQMRGKGIIIEVKDKKNVEAIEKINLGNIRLKAEKPNKIDLYIIIYNVKPGN